MLKSVSWKGIVGFLQYGEVFDLNINTQYIDSSKQKAEPIKTLPLKCFSNQKIYSELIRENSIIYTLERFKVIYYDKD